MLGPTPLAEPEVVTVQTGAAASRTSSPAVDLTTAMSAELSLLIDEAVPFETNATNNAGSSTVEVTEHELVRSNVFVRALGGYGAQFNQHVYAPVTNPPVATLPDLEAKVKALEPQLVRIFYNDNFEERQPNRAPRTCSRSRTRSTGPRGGGDDQRHLPRRRRRPNDPPVSMSRFAGVLEDLVEAQGSRASAGSRSRTSRTRPATDARPVRGALPCVGRRADRARVREQSS